MAEAITLYPGCLISRRFPGFLKATQFVCDKLQIPHQERNSFSCCPDPVWARSFDEKTWLLLAARNISVAEKGAKPLVTLCNGCFETLNTANRILKKDKKKREEINRELDPIGREYTGKIDVWHILHYIYEHYGPDRVREAVSNPLKGPVIAVHPGCHFSRPSEFAQTDNPIAPRILEEMLLATGAESHPYPGKNLCCGLPVFATDRELSLAITDSKLKALKGADGIVVVCPSCFMQFENAQIVLKKEEKIPVFYYFELLALAMGASFDNLGFSSHRVDVGETIEKMGVLAYGKK